MSNIVIIEDDRLMRELLVEWLGAAGYSVHAPAVGGVVVPYAAADLVIVDVYMPRDRGEARIAAVKAAYPEAPMIAISGQFRPGLAGPCTAARSLRVRQVIAKPFSRDDLLAAVEHLIGLAA